MKTANATNTVTAQWLLLPRIYDP